MPQVELENETDWRDCIVCTSVSAEKVYRRERNVARRFFIFLINIFMED